MAGEHRHGHKAQTKGEDGLKVTHGRDAVGFMARGYGQENTNYVITVGFQFNPHPKQLRIKLIQGQTMGSWDNDDVLKASGSPEVKNSAAGEKGKPRMLRVPKLGLKDVVKCNMETRYVADEKIQQTA
ncbi:hypothetical protein B0H10DRAFT_1953261 [Mycena sp. CBHHK59/15]|nr:hypothetical protein B0H10DRAFT_1953261 [Mycena sp. CBHHK59/15]